MKDEVARKQLLKDAITQDLSLSQIKERIRERQTSLQTKKPTIKIDATAKRLKSSKLWESNPKKWNRIQSLLEKIDKLITEN